MRYLLLYLLIFLFNTVIGQNNFDVIRVNNKTIEDIFETDYFGRMKSAMVVDINQDNFKEVVYIDGRYLKILYNSENSQTYDKLDSIYLPGYNFYINPTIDLNKNGINEILFRKSDNGFETFEIDIDNLIINSAFSLNNGLNNEYKPFVNANPILIELNNNGKPDVLYRNYAFELNNLCDFSIPYENDFVGYKFYKSENFYDLNSDGFLDLVVANGDLIQSYLNNGNGQFQYYKTIAIGEEILKISDFNNDNNLDILYLNYHGFSNVPTCDVNLLYNMFDDNKETVDLSYQLLINNPAPVHDLSVNIKGYVDFNNDKLLDIISGNNILLIDWDRDGDTDIFTNSKTIIHINNENGFNTLDTLNNNNELVYIENRFNNFHQLSPPKDINFNVQDNSINFSWEDENNKMFDIKLLENTKTIYNNDGTFDPLNALFSNTYTHTNLKPGEYSFNVREVDYSGNFSDWANGITFEVTNKDTFPPANINSIKYKLIEPQPQNLKSANIGSPISISWENPSDLDFNYVKIIKREDRFPQNADDGELVYEGKGEYFIDSLISPNKFYYFSAFTCDYHNNVSVLDIDSKLSVNVSHNNPPRIKHIPLRYSLFHDSIFFSCIIDDDIEVVRAFLNFKFTLSDNWEKIKLEKHGRIYSYKMNTTNFPEGTTSLDYFFESTDGYSNVKFPEKDFFTINIYQKQTSTFELLTGKIIDIFSEKPLQCEIVYKSIENDTLIKTNSDTSGFYKLFLPFDLHPLDSILFFSHDTSYYSFEESFEFISNKLGGNIFLTPLYSDSLNQGLDFRLMKANDRRIVDFNAFPLNIFIDTLSFGFYNSDITRDSIIEFLSEWENRTNLNLFKYSVLNDVGISELEIYDGTFPMGIDKMDNHDILSRIRGLWQYLKKNVQYSVGVTLGFRSPAGTPVQFQTIMKHPFYWGGITNFDILALKNKYFWGLYLYNTSTNNSLLNHIQGFNYPKQDKINTVPILEDSVHVSISNKGKINLQFYAFDNESDQIVYDNIFAKNIIKKDYLKGAIELSTPVDSVVKISFDLTDGFQINSQIIQIDLSRSGILLKLDSLIETYQYQLDSTKTLDFSFSYNIKTNDVTNTEYFITESTITSLNEINNSKSNFIIFPNPNEGKFRIRFENRNSAKFQVQLFNNIGQLQCKKEVANEEEIDISYLQQGIYIIKVFDGNEVKTGKVILK